MQEHWMTLTDVGLYCRPADIYIDPIKPVPRALITHAHADHAIAGHGEVYATQHTLDIMQIRYGDDMATRQHPLTLRQTIRFGRDDTVAVTLYPAGHILGSAQILLSYQGQRLVVSGDYKRRSDVTCEAFEPVPCDVFITEATFALPVFRHPPLEREIDKIHDALAEGSGNAVLIGAYALGKCQRLIMGLRESGYHRPIYLHGAMLTLCQYYQQQGVALGELVAVNDVTDRQRLAGEIIIAPPSALHSPWSRKLPRHYKALASGWMHIRARARQKQIDIPLVISDHADWDELTATIGQLSAKEIWITHGREDALSHYIHQQGKLARSLSFLAYDDGEETG